MQKKESLIEFENEKFLDTVFLDIPCRVYYAWNPQTEDLEILDIVLRSRASLMSLLEVYEELYQDLAEHIRSQL